MPESIEIKEKLVKLVPHLVLESYRWNAHYTFLGKTPSFILFAPALYMAKRAGLHRPGPCVRAVGSQDRQALPGLY